MITILLLFLLVLGFLWLRLPLKNWLVTSTLVFLVTMISGITNTFFSLFLVVVFGVLLALLYGFPEFRKLHISKPLYASVKKMLPPLSRTEQEAIDAGTVWWDAELFSGAPDWAMLFGTRKPELTSKEEAFLSGPVETLCEMVDDWKITHELSDLPQNIWEFIKSEKFFALNTSTEYGGLGFSAYAQSCIVLKLSTRSASLAATVMVPNSLGPAELIVHYGTDEQKSHYLPRLASGKEVPCFGLTNPWAGSDASGMPDCGIVCKGKFKGKVTLGFNVNWEKRYITLGPVATLLGLAFRAYDPDHLIGDESDLGITCALVPTTTKGISIGDRHYPLDAAFQNGPNQGKNVFVPLDWVIGGKEQIGQGWKMLMESLATGRGISLPAAATGAAKMSLRTASAYASVREQFGIPIGKFEGIQEVLARMAGLTCLADAGRTLMTSAIDLAERPAVMSAIVKQQCTELSRTVVNDAMDLHGGKGICMGPSNYLARTYQQLPIGITVEGANILTRSLIIFGQGIIRCHPYLLKEIQAVSLEDEVEGLNRFDKLITAHIIHATENKMRTFGLGVSRGRLANGYGSGIVRKHTRTIEHLSASFALLGDVSIAFFGGDLKRNEMISGRFADVLSNLFLATAALKVYCDNGELEEEENVVDWACHHALYQAQQNLYEILRNFPNRVIGKMLAIAIFPAGRYQKTPNDDLSRAVAESIQLPEGIREKLTFDVFISSDPDDPLRCLENAFELMRESSSLRKKLRKLKPDRVPNANYEDRVAKLVSSGDLTDEEGQLLVKTRQNVRKAIDVDSFPISKFTSDRQQTGS